MISLAYGMGMLLAFTRERPRGAALLQPAPVDARSMGNAAAAGHPPAIVSVTRAGRPLPPEGLKAAGGVA
jgi:hypothetical protein